MYTAIIIMLCSLGVIKVCDYKDLPGIVSFATVSALIVSVVTIIVSLIVMIW